MKFWKGWGALGLFPLLFGTLVFKTSMELGIKHRGNGPQTGALMALIAVGYWWFGRRLNRGARKISDAGHSLFMIPLQNYGVPLFAAGIFLAVATLWAPP